MTHGVESTAPALLAGLGRLLAVDDLIRAEDLEEVFALARRQLPRLFPDRSGSLLLERLSPYLWSGGESMTGRRQKMSSTIRATPLDNGDASRRRSLSSNHSPPRSPMGRNVGVTAGFATGACFNSPMEPSASCWWIRSPKPIRSSSGTSSARESFNMVTGRG
jgi:hypothetical protein